MDVRNLDAADAFESLDGSTIRELAGRVSLPARRQSLAEATIPVGAATAAHHHLVSEELYFLTAGRGRVRIDDEERDVAVGDCVVIAPGAVHTIANTGDEPLKLLCCCSPPFHPDDTVLAPA